MAQGQCALDVPAQAPSRRSVVRRGDVARAWACFRGIGRRYVDTGHCNGRTAATWTSLPCMTDTKRDDQRRQQHLDAFAAAVRSSPHNLLSQRALDELESRHIAECAAFAATLPRGAQVLDLGTGGGFPGMVVAICRPDLQVTLLDGTTKKVAFLRAFADEHDISVETLDGRAEDLARHHAGAFDVVTARAVAPLERLVPWALPFLRPGGTLHAIKGERWPEELRAAMPTIRHHRARVVAVPTAENEDTDTPRVVIIRTAG